MKSNQEGIQTGCLKAVASWNNSGGKVFHQLANCQAIKKSL